MELYKRFFSDDEIDYGNYDTNYQRIIDADAGGYYTSLVRCKESAIRTERYAGVLKDEFVKVMNSLKNKQFIIVQDLNKELNEYFKKYMISFKYNNVVVKNLDSEKDREALKGGISSMSTYAISKEIVVYVNSNFRPNFKNCNSLLVEDFYLLMCHELVHRGQFILRKHDSFRDVMEKAVQEEKKLRSMNLTPENLKKVMNKKYRRRVPELMAYANQAVEELRFKGFSNDQILAKLRTGKIKEIESPVFFDYIEMFYKNEEEDDNIVLNRFYKYMYQYVTGEEEHNFII